MGKKKESSEEKLDRLRREERTKDERRVPKPVKHKRNVGWFL
jgi:hypothetical protein